MVEAKDDDVINLDELKFIETEEEYLAALDELNLLMNAKEDSEEEKRLERISLMVYDYEEEHYPIV